MSRSKERMLEIAGYYTMAGEKDTCEHYGIQPSSLRRYIRYAKEYFDDFKDIEKNTTLCQIASKYSDKELKSIAAGARLVPGQKRVPVACFEGNSIKLGVLSDTHFGSSYTDTDMVFAAFDEFDKAGVDMVIHAGDVCEGMSNRSGHIYELSHIGFASQKEHAVDVLSQWDATPIYMVSGNHDLWFKKSNGADIVDDICSLIPNAEYLGEHEGDVSLDGKAVLKIWHGGDGSSYALSYRLQKIIECLTGGEKPNVLIAGHVHKALYMYDRHVHCYSAGALQKQTPWMRGKRIASHTGFWIVDITTNDAGVARTQGGWFPFYA